MAPIHHAQAAAARCRRRAPHRLPQPASPGLRRRSRRLRGVWAACLPQVSRAIPLVVLGGCCRNPCSGIFCVGRHIIPQRPVVQTLALGLARAGAGIDCIRHGVCACNSTLSGDWMLQCVWVRLYCVACGCFRHHQLLQRSISLFRPIFYNSLSASINACSEWHSQQRRRQLCMPAAAAVFIGLIHYIARNVRT